MERISQELFRELADISGMFGDEIKRLERVHARLTLATAVLADVTKEEL